MDIEKRFDLHIHLLHQATRFSPEGVARPTDNPDCKVPAHSMAKTL
jgi:hypothetical protein